MEELKKINEAGCVREITMDTGVAAGLGKMDAVSETENEIEMERIPDKHRDLQVKGALGMENTIRPMNKPREEDIAVETESDAQNIDSGDSVKINTGGASISPEDELTMAIRAIQPDDDVNMDNNVLKLEEGVEIKEIQDTEVGKKDDYNAVTEETTVLQSRENSSKIVENKCNLPDTRVDSDIPMDLGDDAIVDSNNVVGPTNNISEPLLDLGGNKSYNESEKRKEVGNIDSPENGKDDHVNGDKADNSVMVIEIDDDDDDSTAAIGESSQKAKEDIMASSILTKNKDEGKPQESTSQGMTQEDSEAPTAFESSCKDVGMQEESKILSKDSLNSSVKSMDCEESVTPSAAEDVNLLEETQTQRQTPDSAKGKLIDDDTSGEVFYNKECINYECPRDHKQFFLAPLFALTYFKISRKNKPQYICSTCYDYALEMYEGFVNLLAAKQPMLLKGVVRGKQEFVEIIDSSDEDDDEEKSEKDNTYLSKDDLKLIEEELDNSIKKVLDKVEIQNQLTWSKTILNSRLKALEAETNCIDEELRTLQKKADQMHVALYLSAKVKDRQLASTDANTGRPYVPPDPELKNLPPIGDLQRPPIQINETYYAVKNKAIASWVPCRVMEQVESTIVSQKLVKNYRIKFLKSHYQMVKTVSAKHMAYFNPPSVRLPVGSRVIAYFDSTSLSRGKEKMMIQSAFYPGVIAEPLKPTNRYRYLVFYDDGYTQYVYHKDVRLVCHVSENVWEDVYPGARDFIQNYLTQYSINRPMVQTQKGQSMTTESYGKWSYARVVDIDCSLIQMQFEGAKSHTEWIYRGSLRLGPVFKEYQKTAKTTQMPVSRLPRRTEPFIRYTEDEDETTPQEQHEERERQLQQQNEPRAVAKKSVSRRESSSSCDPAPTVRHLNNSTIYLEDESRPKGKVVYYTAKRNMPPRPYEPHTCKPSCLFPILHNLSAYSPLSKPLLSGWERLIVRQKVKRVISYRGPCGKIVRNMKELHHYLRATKNVLNVENFDFSPETNCLAEYVIDSAIVQMRDISGGQEKMAIPLVNYYDNTMPPECKYAAQRIPTEGVNLNLDEEFLVGCDCEGDCSDKAKCSCWQLTYAGAKYGNPNTPMEEIGYQYKRLYEHVPTGIYECNSRCKCKSNCLNRVVQHSLEMKLQVFKTSNRGWGLRCINDIPRGSFICVYAGHLLTEDRANEGGLDVGDEYFAELDYIEVAEQIKEGYESDVESGEHEDDDDDEIYEQEDDDEFTPSKPVGIRASKGRPQRSTRGSNAQATEEDSQERQMINFNPNANMDENSMRESSIRKLYGKDESCYVMDAKITGNLGRYFNHSCSPNLFVQNVFVDTHDLRFPWVAFFSSTHIRAGTELTWNYNYEVGVVPGKVLYCQCGAPNCRLRLL